MKKIKKYFLELKSKNIKVDDVSSRTNISYEKAKSIGVLFSSENLQSIDGLADFIKQLQLDGKQVKALTFQELQQKDNLKIYNFNHHVITEKDISLFGEIKSFLVEEFVATEFDYLFCVDTKPFDVFKSIMTRSHAKCRIGKYIESQMCFELMIKMDENDGTDALIKQMSHYVKTIRNDEK